MNDPEALIRRDAKTLLSTWFDVDEEAKVQLRDGNVGFVDLLARPLESSLCDLSLAFEVKNVKYFSDDVAGRWLKQASDYVFSKPCNGWPTVAASFFWRVGIPDHDREPDYTMTRGIVQAAHHFRVGSALISKKGEFELWMGSHRLLRQKLWWNAHAGQWLRGKRQDAGVRRPLSK